MAKSIFERVKKQNGEKFAQELRTLYPKAMDDERTLRILEFAGRDPESVPGLVPAVANLLAKVEPKDSAPPRRSHKIVGCGRL